MWVMGHSWVEIQNEDTDSLVILRLQNYLELGEPMRITSVILPFEGSRDITGSDLRAIPVAALNAAFNRHEIEGQIKMRIGIALAGSPAGSPLDPLPPASATDRFAALVARQYMEIERPTGTGNVARRLAELNGAPLPSAQRWIARARKHGYLPPATPANRRG